MKIVKADVVITNHRQPMINGLVSYDENTGVIEKVWQDDNFSGDVEKFRGVLIPGYVNAHCHLELSHLRGIIPSGTGLIDFITGVISLRDFDQEIINEAISTADQEMQANGIVAVGDISNATDTILTKLESPIHYHTFVEYFDLWQSDNQEQLTNYNRVFGEFFDSLGHRVSKVPHATYSVSDHLFDLLNHQDGNSPISIHNQEVLAEDEFIKNGSGAFCDFYKKMGLSLENIKARNATSLQHTISRLNPQRNTLLVHNTMTQEEDITVALNWSPNVYWVTCPNANLYIENRLPDYKSFMSQEVNMCIGTDSLSSNWQLSIFEEMRTIKRYQSTIPDVDLIQWATLNGAKALGIDDQYGRIVAGTSPGLNLLDVEVNDGVFDIRDVVRSVKVV